MATNIITEQYKKHTLKKTREGGKVICLEALMLDLFLVPLAF